MLEDDIAANRAIGGTGVEAIDAAMPAPKAVVNVLTHCNTGSLATAQYGTALGVIRALHEAGRLGHAYCTETRCAPEVAPKVPPQPPPPPHSAYLLRTATLGVLPCDWAVADGVWSGSDSKRSRSGVAASRCERIGRDQDLYPMFDIVSSQPPIWRSRCQRCLRRKAAARQKPGASAFA